MTDDTARADAFKALLKALTSVQENSNVRVVVIVDNVFTEQLALATVGLSADDALTVLVRSMHKIKELHSLEEEVHDDNNDARYTNNKRNIH